MAPRNARVVPLPANIPYKKQSVAVPGTKKPGQTAHYQNGVYGMIGLETPNALQTLDEVFETGLSAGKDRPCLGYRPVESAKPLKYADHFVWETYGQKGEIGGGEIDTVGLWSANRPEWQIIDIALQSYNKVSVSLYDTLGKESVEYIIDHARLTIIFATAGHIPTLLKLVPKLPVLKLIVSIDELSPEAHKLLTAWSQTLNIQVKDLREIEALGKTNLIDPIPVTPDHLASICYTSGTTSNPKGVVLKHKHLATGTQSNLYGLDLPEDASILSYLPLAHIYERIAEMCVFAVGGKVGYFTGDPLRLLEDAQILKPNFFPSVPRVLNRVYQAAMVAANAPGLKGALFKKAMQVKLDKLHSTGDNTHIFWDKLIFRKIQAVLGGNLKFVASGSAPISSEVMDFLKIALACEVAEGRFIPIYGMTENCATCTKTLPNDPSSSGTVGPPQPATEIKLIDVPAMGYTSEDRPNPRGELCSRGDICFTTYYKDEKNTIESVDAEGWIHTGDVAELDACGRFKIIDRVKNIMKLAQGEYVALEKIENLYSASPVVAQIYIHGDSLQSYLLAVVVPDPVQLAVAVSSVTGAKVKPDDFEALAKACKDERVNKHFLTTLSREAKRNGLKGFETIKRIHLTLDAFTVDDGTMTPTMKIRRKDAYNKFKTELDGLYSLGEPQSSYL